MCCVIKNYNSICIFFYALSFGEERKSYVTEADSSINLPFPCAHVYVGEHTCERSCPCVCMCLWSMLSVFLHLPLIFWDKASHWTSYSVIGQSGWLSSSRAPPTSASPVLDVWPNFLCGFWGSEFNPSYLSGKHFTESSIWPLPFYFDSLLLGAGALNRLYLRSHCKFVHLLIAGNFLIIHNNVFGNIQL